MVSNIFDGKKLDFSEKSESPDSSDSSVLTYEAEAGAGGSYCKEKSSAEDDDASVWSIQVNASTRDEDEEVLEEEDYYDEEADEIEEEEEEEDGGLVDELCEGISKIFVDEKREAPKFAGKHTRFVYDSDDELIIGEEEGRAEIEGSGGVSPSVLRLKGLPTPKGKHLRFPVQAEEEE